MNNINIESKFWISKDGIKIFGEGPYLLLKMVEKFGSLNKAAKEINMSYSKAWTIIKRAEDNLKYPLLKTATGGIDGGGSDLTLEAKKLIIAYENFKKEAERHIKELFKEHFSEI